jgi:predicted MPP superfamily phosphohydrolase
MSLFLLFFFAIYGTLHLYAFLKVRAAFGPLRPDVLIATILFLTAMTVAPLLVRLAERKGFEALAGALAQIGYLWLGFIFLFVCVAAAIDLYRVLAFLVDLVARTDRLLPRISALAAFLLPCCMAIGISVYGYFEAQAIRTEHVVLTSPKIPAALGRLRIVQISDVHLGLMVGARRLTAILDAVRKAEPDLLVSTGDLVDGQADGLAGLAGQLAAVHPPYGKYAITGNHEFYAGIGQSLAFTRQAGFTVLRNREVTVAGALNLVGIDDPAGRAMGEDLADKEKEVLTSLDPDRFTLLLKHRPSINPESKGLFDLQLSGHVHMGQIFPFNLLTWWFYPVHAGRLNRIDDHWLYVSRGSGTWGPPIRFLAPPEVTIIDLRHG